MIFVEPIRDSKLLIYWLILLVVDGGPRNFTLVNTSHKYIAYLDDDNWWEPNHLEALYAAIKEKDVDFVFTGTRVFDEEGNLMSERIATSPGWGCIDTSEIMHNRRLIIDVHGGWHWQDLASVPCDWDLVSRWLNGGATWAHTNQITLNYTIRASGISTPRDHKKIQYKLH